MKTKNIFRMLLVAAALLMGANNVKAVDLFVSTNPEGDEINSGTQKDFPKDAFADAKIGDVIRVWGETFDAPSDWNWSSTPHKIQIVYYDGTVVFEADDFDGGEYIDFILTDNDIIAGFVNLPDWTSRSGAIQGEWIKVKKVELTSVDSRTSVNLSFNGTWKDITVGDASADGLALTSDVSNLPITYTSESESIATINATGKVTGVTPGITKITASFVGNDTYKPASKSYTLIVKHAFSGTTEGTSIWTGSTYFGDWHQTYGSYVTINSSTIPSTIKEKDKLRFYVAKETLGTDKDGAEWQLQLCNQDWSNIKTTNHWTTDDNSSISTNGYIDVEVNTDNLASIQNGVYVQGHNITLFGVTLIPAPAAAVDVTLSFNPNSQTVKVGETINGPTITATANDGATTVTGLTYTYTSNDTSIATVNSEGAVTGVAEGNTTITVSWAAITGYNAGSATYTVNVTPASAPAKQDVTLAFSPSTVTATMGETFEAPTLTASVEGLAITYSSSNTTIAEVDASGNVTLVAPGTTVITASFSGNNDYNAASASYTLTVKAAAEYISVDDNNIGENGYRTYVTWCAVDLSRSVNVEAYYATGLNSARTEVEFTQVTGVCASGVPLLLKATVTGASEYKLLKSSATGTTPTDNKLQAGQGTEVSGDDKYVLTKHSGQVVFAEVNIVGAIVGTEYAYLDLNGSNARGRLSIRLNGESTGISTIQNDERDLDGIIYNLRGQRVEHPTKGIYIINGKKVIIK